MEYILILKIFQNFLFIVINLLDPYIPLQKKNIFLFKIFQINLLLNYEIKNLRFIFLILILNNCFLNVVILFQNILLQLDNCIILILLSILLHNCLLLIFLLYDKNRDLFPFNLYKHLLNGLFFIFFRLMIFLGLNIFKILIYSYKNHHNHYFLSLILNFQLNFFMKKDFSLLLFHFHLK